MKKLLILCIFVLSGCASTQTQQVVTSTQVKVPVAMLCTVTYPDKPVDHLADLKDTDSILTKGDAAIAELKEFQIYSDKLMAALIGCTTPAPAQATQNDNTTPSQPQ